MTGAFGRVDWAIVPALLKLGALFAIVILLLRLRLPLSLALLSAALAGGFLFAIPLGRMIAAFREGAFGWRSWHLLFCILTITTLGGLLRRRGKLTEMARAAERILKSRKLALGAVPALIGMMPMPGGAMLSAPMVEELDEKQELTAEEKASVNYLFRHVMEFFFPLYPGLLLFASLLQVPVFKVVYALFPLFVVLILVNLHFLKRQVKISPTDTEKPVTARVWQSFFSGLWPVVLIVGLSLGLRLEILSALLGTLFLAALFFRAGAMEVLQSLKEGIGPETVLSILAIMIFQNVLAATPQLAELPGLFAAARLPAWVPVFCIPVVVGLLTGMTTAYLGLTFPLLSAFLLPASASVNYGMAMLAYTGGFLGIMGSPAHLCLVLTFDFFKPRKLLVYRQMLFPLLFVGAAALTLFATGFPWGLIR